MGLTTFSDDFLEINVDAAIRRQPSVEAGCRLTPCFTNLVRFERTLDDVGYGAIFATRKPVSKVPCFCAAHGELWFGHVKLRLTEI